MEGRNDGVKLEGSLIGHYQIEARLGAGGMGVVYLAKDVRLGRRVAIKFLPSHLSGEPSRRERFLAEARAASNLDHPNIGTIFGIEETPDAQPYLVMSFYEGLTVGQMLQQGPIPVGQAVDIALQSARGLKEAHARGVVHRDVKPSNLIVTPKGVVKIVDFGLAKLMGEVGMTHPGTVIGTASYMSPEQAAGQAVDLRADVWSLGVVLYEMLTGQNPFAGENYYAVLHAVLHREPDWEQLPAPVLRGIVRRALAKDPGQRTPSMDELLRELEAALTQLHSSSGEQTRSMVLPPDRGAREAGPKPPRRRAWLAGLAGLAALALAGVWLVPRFVAPAPRAVAVLPFKLIAETPQPPGLADGLCETMTSKLTELEKLQGSLWVVPASEVQRRKAQSVEDARREFGVDLVVTGSVQRLGSSLRMSLNVVDAKTLRQVGAAVLDEPNVDWLRLQDQAVSRLTALLSVKGEVEAASVAISGELYESYLDAVGLLQRWDKAGNLARSVELLERVVLQAPRFLDGQVALANAYWTTYTQVNDPTWMEKARKQAEAARGIDASSARVHEIMGRILAGGGQRDLALIEFQEALKTDPRSYVALQGLARTYESLKRFSEAESAHQRSVTIRPNAWNVHNNYAVFLYNQQRYEEAAGEWMKVLELTPDNNGVKSNLANAYKHLGRPRQAEKLLLEIIEKAPGHVPFQNLGTLYFEENDFVKSAQMFENALRYNDKDYRIWGSVGQARRRAGGPYEAPFRKAIELGERALTAAPNNPETRSLLAVYYSALGGRTKAEELLDQMSPLMNANASTWIRVAAVWMELGNRTQAERAVKLAREAGASEAMLSRSVELKPLLQTDGTKTPRSN